MRAFTSRTSPSSTPQASPSTGSAPWASSPRSLLRHEVEEALLHERVKTARRLVEQEHVRARHERRYDRDLLPVALGHPADPRTEVQLKDISELQHPGAVTHAPHPRHEVEEGPRRHLLHAGALAGQVT